MSILIRKIILILMALVFPLKGFSFPEMVRHGYVNCSSCHMSPTGSGVLSKYGRALSKEILSHKSEEGESDFAYGIIPTPEWLALGGDFRGLVIYKNTPINREGLFIPMQADLEAVASVSTVSVGGTVGIAEGSSNGGSTRSIISRRHTVQFRPTDEMSFRAGRFQPSFGINTPDHAIVTKRGLSWDQGSETYNLETAWMGEKYNATITGVFGRPDQPTLYRETGAALNTSLSFEDRFKSGVSVFLGSDPFQNRQVYGVWGILGFTTQLYMLSELDFQNTSSGTSSQMGYVNYNKIGYEFFQGFHVFSTFEFQKTDFSINNSLNKFIAIGAQYFPRPHFEFSLTAQRRDNAFSEESSHYAYLLLHFYP